MTTRRLTHRIDPRALQLLERLERYVDYAFQPIVSTNSGRCFGVEALLRGAQRAGFDSIDHVFDTAFDLDALCDVDILLKQRAFRKFSEIPNSQSLRLFFNIDNRLLGRPDYRPNRTLAAVKDSGLPMSNLVLEVSERKHVDYVAGAYETLRSYRTSTIQVALDDFGTGFSGLALLYDTHPDFLKIDRYFVSELATDQKKKVFVSHVVSLAKTLGIRVIAEGVETASEYYACREIGCDFVQGYLVQKPTTRVRDIETLYVSVTQLSEQERRRQRLESRFVQDQLDRAPAIDAGMRMEDIFESFRLNPQRSFFPFLNGHGEPVGLIRETELKGYIYSPYGRDLLSRKHIRDHLDLFVRRCPIADINTPVDRILEQYALSPSRDGVLITQDGVYSGVLSAEALVLAVQERNLELARDQNPLTGLPGNPSIDRFIAERRPTESTPLSILYFDLDNFKAFNDKYGFRLGDRALRMFSEVLQKRFPTPAFFVGHIGGDDFFVGTETLGFEAVHTAAKTAVAEFKVYAESLYDAVDREARFIHGKNRNGSAAVFPLLSASCAYGVIHHHTTRKLDYDILPLITALKAQAKTKGNTVCAATVI